MPPESRACPGVLIPFIAHIPCFPVFISLKRRTMLCGAKKFRYPAAGRVATRCITIRYLMIYAGKILSFLALNEPIAFAIIDKVISI
jgi:hypothetical protein